MFLSLYRKIQVRGNVFSHILRSESLAQSQQKTIYVQCVKFPFTFSIFVCNWGQSASFKNVKNTFGGMSCNNCSFTKKALLCKCFFMFLNKTNRLKSQSTLYICYQDLFFFKRNHYKNINMKTSISFLSLRIYFMCLIFVFSFGDLIER